MSDFNDKLRLKEKAEEDMYFARRDRELIRQLHEEEDKQDHVQEQPAGTSAEHQANIADGKQVPRHAGGYYSRLMARILRFFRRGVR